MKNIWHFIAGKLSKNQSICLLVNTQSHSSIPVRPGHKMAVVSDGTSYGSIGGGAIENNLVLKARKLLKEKNTTPFLFKQDLCPVSGRAIPEMICTGEQIVAFFPLNPAHLSVVQEIMTTIAQNKAGALRISVDAIRFNPGELLNIKNHLETQNQDGWEYTEQLGLPDRLFIFGAGHIGLALSQLFSTLDFQLTIFDNREGLATFEDNHFADFKKIVDFNTIGNLIPEGENIYVVVMTFAHQNDELVVRQLLSKKVKYLGMMASKKRAERFFSHFREEGVPQHLLDEVDAPIGFKIGSETPAEIAISIAAKIISVRRT